MQALFSMYHVPPDFYGITCVFKHHFLIIPIAFSALSVKNRYGVSCEVTTLTTLLYLASSLVPCMKEDAPTLPEKVRTSPVFLLTRLNTLLPVSATYR